MGFEAIFVILVFYFFVYACWRWRESGSETDANRGEQEGGHGDA